MPVIDDIRAERKAVMQNGTFKQKIKYFWDYNKGKVLAVAFAAAFVITVGYKMIADPEIILNGVMLNVFEKTGQDASADLQKEFTAFAKPKAKTEVQFNTSMFYMVSNSGNSNENYQTMQKLLTLSATGDLDFITADRAAMTDIAYFDFFYDLREVLTNEQIKKYQSRFLYIDLAVLDKIKESNANFEDSSKIKKPDCTNPDEMETPVPVLIDIGADNRLGEKCNYSAETLALGVSGEKHKDMLAKFLAFVIE